MEKLKFRVADYGAVGDGVTDDGPAISRAAAAAAAAAGEKAVVFEPKTYRILDLPAENRRHCLLRGDDGFAYRGQWGRPAVQGG